MSSGSTDFDFTWCQIFALHKGVAYFKNCARSGGSKVHVLLFVNLICFRLIIQTVNMRIYTTSCSRKKKNIYIYI